MSESSSRRDRRMAMQNKGVGGGNFEKVFDAPESVERLKLEVMKPVIFDIIPVIIDDHHPNYPTIKADSEKHNERCDDWCVPFALHKGLKGVSQHVCRNWGKLGDRKCPTCDLRSVAVNEGKDPKSDDVKSYNASQRAGMCVCPVGGEQDGEMVLLEGARSWQYDKIKEAADRENVFLLDTSIDGMSIKATPQAFTYTDSKTHEKTTIPGELYIEFVPRTFGYEEADLVEALPICDFLNFKSYEDIFTMVHGLTDMPSEESEEDKEIIPPKTEPAPTGATAEARTPSTSSRRGGRGGTPAASTEESTPRGRSRGGRAKVSEDEITF